MRALPPAIAPYIEDLDTGRLERIFGVTNAIVVPPSVKLLCRGTGLGPSLGGGDAAMLRYPVPPAWVWPSDGSALADLQEAGWRYVDPHDDVLMPFLQLARDARPERVRAFAARFGPLWQCRVHRGYVWACESWRERTPCRWAPYDEVRAFAQEAARLQAVLDATSLLKDGKSVSAELAAHLTYVDPDAPLQHQQCALMLGIGVQLATLDAGQVRPVWVDTTSPRLALRSGLGCLPRAWVEVSQLIGGRLGVGQCDECGRWSMRKRKPQVGRGQFCSQCGHKAAQRHYRARQRSQQRQDV